MNHATPPILVDTHTHIFLEEFDEDIDDLLHRAHQAGVVYTLLPNLDTSSLPSLLNFCDKRTGEAFPMIGLHPSYVKEDYRDQLSSLQSALSQSPERFIAIGEIGLDYHWSTDFKAEMNDALRTQLRWALEYDLPVSLHARDAVPDVINAIREVGEDRLRGVFHSFTGTEGELREIIDTLPRFYVGVNGVVTFKNSHLPEIFERLAPPERLLIETDAPYLAPTPKRGKRNEPSYLTYILHKLSEIYFLSMEEMAQTLLRSTMNLFHLPSPVSTP